MIQIIVMPVLYLWLLLSWRLLAVLLTVMNAVAFRLAGCYNVDVFATAMTNCVFEVAL